MDRNGDRRITRDEYNNAFFGPDAVSEKLTRAEFPCGCFAVLDKNRDGFLQEAEYKAGFSDLFDRDRNDFISMGELRAGEASAAQSRILSGSFPVPKEPLTSADPFNPDGADPDAHGSLMDHSGTSSWTNDNPPPKDQSGYYTYLVSKLRAGAEGTQPYTSFFSISGRSCGYMYVDAEAALPRQGADIRLSADKSVVFTVLHVKVSKKSSLARGGIYAYLCSADGQYHRISDGGGKWTNDVFRKAETGLGSYVDSGVVAAPYFLLVPRSGAIDLPSDTFRSSTLSLAQARSGAALAAFSALDTNDDGCLSKGEFAQQTGEFAWPPFGYVANWSANDGNCTRAQISPADYLTQAAGPEADAYEAQSRFAFAAFSALDTDDDACLSQGEFAQQTLGAKWPPFGYVAGWSADDGSCTGAQISLADYQMQAAGCADRRDWRSTDHRLTCQEYRTDLPAQVLSVLAVLTLLAVLSLRALLGGRQRTRLTCREYRTDVCPRRVGARI
jgi:Ca2+-binding EF-hand superfamily protein